MKDPFKILKNLEEKVKKKYKTNSLDDSVRKDMLNKYSFRLVPAKAFKSITKFSEYKHLKKGLMVAEKKMVFDDIIQELTYDGFKIKHQIKGMEIHETSYLETKALVDKMHGLMLTPAEFFCVTNYLSTETKKIDSMYYDMVLKGSEFLDAVAYFKNAVVVRPYHVPEDKNEQTFSPFLMTENFEVKDINPRTGIPTDYDEDGGYRLMAPSIYPASIRRSTCNKWENHIGPTNMPTIDITKSAYWSDPGTGIRLCYLPDSDDMHLFTKRWGDHNV